MFMTSLKLSLAAIVIILAAFSVGYAQEPARPSPPMPDQPSQKAEVGSITVAELKAKLENGDPVVILDSRSDTSYNASDKQIKGAIRVPPSFIGSHIKDIPKDKELVVYCA